MNLEAIIFVPALVGCVVFGFVFALFAAHHYLTVLQGTAAGARHVTYLSEPILDNFWKVFYLAWLIGLWLGPAWLLGRAWAGPDGPRWLKLAVPLGVFWVCYPVSQLSSLGGPTIWLPLVPGVLDRLARKPLVVLGFLALSGLVLALFGLAFYWTFLADGIERLMAGSILLVLAALLYARLLGRLAFVLAFTRSVFDREPKKKRPRPEREEGEPRTRDDPAASDGEEAGPRFVQPSDLPPLASPDEGPLTGYDVRFEDDPPPKPRRRVVAEVVESEAEPGPRPRRPVRDGDDEDVPYGVGRPEATAGEWVPAEVVRPSAAELRLLSRDDAPKPPTAAWSAEVPAFLAQPETLAVVGMLSGMCFAVGGMVRIARAFNPAADGG
jgi:hypothetical protein